MTISSLSSASAAYSPSTSVAPKAPQTSASTESKQQEDTVHLSPAALAAAASHDVDHDGDSH